MSVTCDRSTSALSFFIYLTVAETSEQADRQYRENFHRCRHPLVITVLAVRPPRPVVRCCEANRPERCGR